MLCTSTSGAWAATLLSHPEEALMSASGVLCIRSASTGVALEYIRTTGSHACSVCLREGMPAVDGVDSEEVQLMSAVYT